MKIRLLIKGDAIQYGENDFYCPCRTIDVDIANNLIDKEHEHIIGVEVEPQESEDRHCKDCKWWKDSDGEFRRGVGAESKCPINRQKVFEGNGYCYMFEPQESEE